MLDDLIAIILNLIGSSLPEEANGWSIYEKIFAAIAIISLILFIALLVCIAFFKDVIFPRGFY
jgi:hypothetical protein